MDLLDYHRGTLSARRVRVLVQHLPRDSAFVQELQGEEAQWGLGEHLMASAVDQLAIGNWLFTAAHTAEHDTVPDPPVPLPRPGMDEDPEEDPVTDGTDIAAFFSGL
ncbi:hypothetical protein [Actinomadura macrotermitis]|uniref:Uncharacterized protein n=1 Tax=Actinomadura macrotermitis TaxID=2585200 RepID=A0A7K0C2W6_9ACTN|nr:hypothetical protein [Actinomadura macrotermitis]MQY07758.1 hypothetical protein [Actinomadura macrotermitis]